MQGNGILECSRTISAQALFAIITDTNAWTVLHHSQGVEVNFGLFSFSCKWNFVSWTRRSRVQQFQTLGGDWISFGVFFEPIVVYID